MRTEKEKEIHRILSGFIRYDGGCIKAANDFVHTRFQGFYSGVGLLSLFGTSQRGFDVSVSDVNDKNRIVKAFYEMGTPVGLDSEPNGYAVMCPSMIFKTSLLTLNDDGNDFAVGFYATRSVLNWLSFLRQKKRFMKKLDSVELKGEKKKEKKKK